MKYRALVSFTGIVSMNKGEVREISDLSIASGLLKAKYVEEFVEKATAKTSGKKTRSGKKKESAE